MSLTGNFSPENEDIINSTDNYISLDSQKYRQRQEIFNFIKWFCGASYTLFIIFLSELHTYDSIRCCIAKNPHMILLALALFLVPSIMLWTVIRAVYKSNDRESKLGDNKDLENLISMLFRISNSSS